MRAELAHVVKRRLEICKAGGNFSPAEFGQDFGFSMEIAADTAEVAFEAYTPEGALFLTELATSTHFFQGVRR